MGVGNERRSRCANGRTRRESIRVSVPSVSALVCQHCRHAPTRAGCPSKIEESQFTAPRQQRSTPRETRLHVHRSQAQRARALQLLHITTQEHPQIRRMWGACIALPVSKVIHAHTSARVPWRGSSYELPSHAGSGTRASRAATGNLPAHMRHCNVQVKDQRASKPEPQCVVRGQPSGLRHTYAHNRNDGCVACPVDRRFRRRRNKHGAESRSEFNVRFC